MHNHRALSGSIRHLPRTTGIWHYGNAADPFPGQDLWNAEFNLRMAGLGGNTNSPDKEKSTERALGAQEVKPLPAGAPGLEEEVALESELKAHLELSMG